MSRDEFDSTSTMYECRVLSRVYFGEILSHIGISELACSACQLTDMHCKQVHWFLYQTIIKNLLNKTPVNHIENNQLIGFYMSYSGLSWINFWLC